MTTTIDAILRGVPPSAHRQYLRRWIASSWESHHSLMKNLSDKEHPFFRDSINELLTIVITCQDLINDGLINTLQDPITTSKAQILAKIDIARLTALAKWQAKSKKLHD